MKYRHLIDRLLVMHVTLHFFEYWSNSYHPAFVLDTIEGL